MDIKLKKIEEGSKEAELLSLCVRFYDYYSDPVKDDIYWQSMIRHANEVHKRFKDTEFDTVASTMVVGMCEALEEKYKARGGK